MDVLNRYIHVKPIFQHVLYGQSYLQVLWIGVLKICSKFTGEHPCQSVISIKFQSNFIEITLRHGYSPVNLLRISRAPFPNNTSRWLLLYLGSCKAFILHIVYTQLQCGCYYIFPLFQKKVSKYQPSLSILIYILPPCSN